MALGIPISPDILALLASVVNGSEGARLVGWKDAIGDGGETVFDILDDTVNPGILDRVTLSDDGGLDVSWSAGEVYDGSTGTVVEVDAGSDTCTNNAVNFLVYKPGSGSTLVLQTSRADTDAGEIDIGHFHAQAGDILANPHQESILSERERKISASLADIMPLIVTSGLIVSEHAGANAFDVDSTLGEYFHEGHERHAVDAIDSTVTDILRHFKTGGAWDTDTNSQIDITQYNDGTDLAAVSPAKYHRSLFIIAPDNKIHWVYPTEEFLTVNLAINGSDPPVPPGLVGFPKSTAVIMQTGDTGFPTAGGDRWIDVRPILTASQLSVISSHLNLTDIGNNTHAQLDVHVATGLQSVHAVGANVDFLKFTAENLATHAGATLPVDPAKGFYLQETTGRKILLHYDGSNYVPLHSFGSMTIYVNGTDGTDSLNKGFGIGEDAFATIQFAIDAIPGSVGGHVNINVNGETYRETVTVQGKIFTGNYSINVNGVLTSEVGSQSVTSATANTLTKSGAGWSVNAYQEMFCKVTKSGEDDIYITIRSNTSDALILAGQFGVTIDSSWDFEILSRGTIISGADSGSPTTPVRDFCIHLIGQSSINFYDIAIEYSNDSGIKLEQEAKGTLYRVHTTMASAQRTLLCIGGSKVIVHSSYMFTSGAEVMRIIEGSIFELVRVWVENVVTSNISGIRMDSNVIGTIDKSLISDSWRGVSCVLGTTVKFLAGAGGVNKSYIEDCTTGIRVEENGAVQKGVGQNYSGNVDDYTTGSGGQIS